LKTPGELFLIAGSGRYPGLVIAEARRAGVARIVVAAFEGETEAATADAADEAVWMRVGQLGRLLDAARGSGARAAIMAGQLAPRNLFDLRPDMKALVLLARLPRRNAETLFGEVANQLDALGVTLLPATTFLDPHLAPEGPIAGPKPKARILADITFGFPIAKETSRMDIGQSVVVKNGTVLAVEAFEGTDACMERGGALGRGGAVLVKVTKPGQDMRFDVPVIGLQTLDCAHRSGISTIAVEAGATLLLDKPAVTAAAARLGIAVHGVLP
jgi:UDP-2,3-diacylglucosamine hydrolase